MDNSDILDSNLLIDTERKNIEIVNSTKFCVLCFTTFGIYVIWWMYKSWKFLKEKDNLDILPVARAVFGILFTFSLFERIQKYALTNGYQEKYSSGTLFAGFLVVNFLSKLPDPYWLISLLSFLFLIQPVQALNFAISNSNSYNAIDRKGFNARQLILIVFGVIFIGLVFLGLLLPDEEY